MEIKGILTKRHEAAGLMLTETSDDFVMLCVPGFTEGIPVAVFSQQATPESIREAADSYLALLRIDG